MRLSRKSFGTLVVFLLFLCTSAVASTIDTTTHGNWIGKYGSDGYILTNYYRVPTTSGTANVYDGVPLKTTDAAVLPPYIADYNYGGGAQAYVWESNSTDQRFPQDPANPSGPRNST